MIERVVRDSSAEQMDRIFHELHADGCHPLCTVCNSQC
jgi:hypothetical protein